MTARGIVRSAVAIALALLAGCGKRPPTTYYVLDAPVPTTAPAIPADGVDVGVGPFHVDPPYDRERIFYRLGTGTPEIGIYNQHRWVEAPGRMLPGLVAGALAGTPGVRIIEPVSPGRRYDAYVSGRLFALEEVDLPGGPSVRARLGLRLLDAEGVELWSDEMSGSVAVSTRDVSDVVAAMQRLILELVTEARAGFEGALPPG